eukprot:Skav222788  [mRNA]  locus=scaffold1254:99475:100229:+ [translate_table: standard]
MCHYQMFASVAVDCFNLKEFTDIAGHVDELEGEAEEEAETEDHSNSKIWSLLNLLKVTKGQVLSSDNLGLIKMPSPTKFSAVVPAPAFFRHHGKCVENGQKFKVGDLVTLAGDHFKIPAGSVVEISKLSTNFQHRVYVKYGEKEFLVSYEDLKKMVPVTVEKGVQQWLLATNKSVVLNLPAAHDHHDGSGKLLLPQ